MISGVRSASKKSGESRCPFRFSSRTSTLSTRTAPYSTGSPPELSRVTPKSVKAPRNVATTMCLTENPTLECTGSDFQMPVGIAVFSVTVAIEVPPVESAILDSSNKNYSRNLIMQQLTPKTSPRSTEAFGHLMGAHATLTRELSALLEEQHGLTMSEYEVLFLLSRAGPITRCDGSTSRARCGSRPRASPGCSIAWRRPDWSGRSACAKDARVTYAVLTDAGMKKLRECSPAHLAEVERLLGRAPQRGGDRVAERAARAALRPRRRLLDRRLGP